MGITMGNGGTDIVDTGDQDEVILVFDAVRMRADRGLDARFDQVVRDLVLGVPVAGCELDAYGISALGMFTAEEIAAREAQADLFDYDRLN